MSVNMNTGTIKATCVPINWQPDISIFASESFLNSVGDEYGWLGGIDGSGKIRCILPYTIIRKLIFRMVRFRVETIPLGEKLCEEEEKSFLNSAMEYFRSIGADMIIPASNTSIFRTYPFGADAAPYGTYIIDLTQSEEVLWNNLHQKHRNVIRNAINKGVEIKYVISNVYDMYELIRDTHRRSAQSFINYETFYRRVIGFGHNIAFITAYYQNEIQGCAIIPFSDYSAYYLYGGSIAKPLTGAMNLLQWDAIKHFHNQGVKRYNFVGVRIKPDKGSKQEGLRRFKERFGGQLVQGYMWKYSFRPVKYTAYSLAVRLLKGGDIVDLERHKLKDY